MKNFNQNMYLGMLQTSIGNGVIDIDLQGHSDI